MHAILYTWSINKFHLADGKSIVQAINNLLTDLPEIIYPVQNRLTRNYINCLGQRGQKPYPVHGGISLYRPYKGIIPPGAFKKGATEEKLTLTKKPSKNNFDFFTINSLVREKHFVSVLRQMKAYSFIASPRVSVLRAVVAVHANRIDRFLKRKALIHQIFSIFVFSSSFTSKANMVLECIAYII